jgi:uncharacterized membrane protein
LDRGELEELVKKDMLMRGFKPDQIEKYFSEVLITIQKKDRRNPGAESGANIYKMKKREKSILFEFEDSYTRLLKGFTIDIRIFFNLLRKMVIIKLNSDKIWTRQFYSQDLKKIFVVMKPLDSVIENRAMVVFILI